MNSFGALGFPQLRTWQERPRIAIDCEVDGVTRSSLLAQRVSVDPAGAILAVALESQRVLLFQGAGAGAAVGVTLPVWQRKALEIDLGRGIGAGRGGCLGPLRLRRARQLGRRNVGRRHARARRDYDRGQRKREAPAMISDFRQGV